MSILKDVLAELIGMFVGDARLSGAVLIVVVVSASLIDLAGFDPLIGGTALLAGCLVVVVASVRRGARRAEAARVAGGPGGPATE
jgi:hypothetical protein